MPFQSIEDPVKLRRVLAAALLLEADLELPALLEHVIGEARSLTGARFAAIGVLDPQHGAITDFIPLGLSPGEERAVGPPPSGGGVLGVVLSDPRALRLAHLGHHPDSGGFPPGHPQMDSFLGVPIKVRAEVYGGIYLTDKLDAPEFTAEDQALVEALSVAAGMAIENTRLHERVRVLAVAADRERTARDLHDTVIQHLYAVGLTLETMAAEPGAAGLQARLEALVSNIGDAISQVRSSIYDLGPSDGRVGIRSSLQDLVHSLRPVVGFEVGLIFGGPVDTVVSDTVADQLLATVREAVTNVGRHAGASSARVAVTVDAGTCQLLVTDDGCGFAPGPVNPEGLGLANMRHRAEQLHGQCTIEAVPAGGTVLTWRVPITS